MFWEWECGMRLCYEVTIANIEIYEVMKRLVKKTINHLLLYRNYSTIGFIQLPRALNLWRYVLYLVFDQIIWLLLLVYKNTSINKCTQFIIIKGPDKYTSRKPFSKSQFINSFLVHLDQRSMGTIAITWHPLSVNFSHFKLLLQNHWANWNQT